MKLCSRESVRSVNAHACLEKITRTEIIQMASITSVSCAQKKISNPHKAGSGKTVKQAQNELKAMMQEIKSLRQQGEGGKKCPPKHDTPKRAPKCPPIHDTPKPGPQSAPGCPPNFEAPKPAPKCPTTHVLDKTFFEGAPYDILVSNGGNCTLIGGSGNDTISGGKGDDLISGRGGNDTLHGGHGNDVIIGGAGNDKISGGKGNDIIAGADGKDVVSGGKGNDTLLGGKGNDTISGGKGHDTLAGQKGDDKLNGNQGNDVLTGGKGDDVINGGKGNDTISVGNGSDIVDGGQGHDTVKFKGNRDQYTVTTKDGVTTVTGNGQGTNTLKNVETLKFKDGAVTVESTAEPKANWTVSEVKDGKATIDLDGKYQITLNEARSEWIIENCENGAKTRIWGDPHVDVKHDGKNDWDFKETTTFHLADGTKITAGTVDRNGNAISSEGVTKGASWTSQLTFTKGDNAIKVTGLASNKDGAHNLAVEKSHDGKALDAATSDGDLTVKETGDNWTAGGKTVDQHIVNAAENAA